MNHLSVIGYKFVDLPSTQNFFESILLKAELSVFGDVLQYRLKDVGGGDLFLYFKKQKSFFVKESKKMFCFIPSYQGKTTQSVKNVHLRPTGHCITCASLNLWVHQDNEEYPLIVDIPNYFEVKDIDWQSVKKINITLFPHSISYWKSKKEYEEEAEKGNNPMANFAPRSFIPSGTFSPTDDLNFVQKAECICTGTIKSFDKKVNGFTQQTFYHLVIDTYGAEYDVVIEEGFFKEEPVVGGLIGGSFWVCGKIIEK